ncbi:hypothetical protein EJB05_51852 [Eragrostis curvula]|uniref:Uncharacterized protein n=1 Tax=Eragrostis curvula TaxID=38414 RepID=A0A5J9SUH5_9POAL|nr:hypothetical protein EJB05_51852 [Eragrostis curvula]
MFYNLMSMEDGLVCIGVEEEPTFCLRLWSRVPAPENDGVESWERGRAIELDTLLPKVVDSTSTDEEGPRRIV